VDAASPDGTADVVDHLRTKYPDRIHLLRRPGKQCLGTAYVAGFAEALRLGAQTIVQMDADLSHPPGTVPALLDGIKDSDVAVGSRYIPGGGATQEWGIMRRLLSQGGDLYVRWVLGLDVQDTKSGFKAFRREALERLGLDTIRSKGFIFQSELLYRCRQLGLTVQEVPYQFQVRRSGRSKMSLGIVIEGLLRPISIRWNARSRS
ncbi:MAG: polyprenol monophosphomannose synthase, partial [Chloroflexi bacterium]|nr:polyprenol monophosphomannose synthase [Chloroflexota bacterium]